MVEVIEQSAVRDTRVLVVEDDVTIRADLVTAAAGARLLMACGAIAGRGKPHTP